MAYLDSINISERFFWFSATECASCTHFAE